MATITSKAFAAVEEAEQLVFYGVCGAVLGLGVCLAVSLYAVDTIRIKIFK